MTEKTKKKDFVEIEFIARNLSNNEIFDTNIKAEAEKINLKLKDKPLIVCIGESMVVKGLDEELEGKEVGKSYTIKIAPEKAFGARNKELVKLIPLKVFTEQKIYPQPGMILALDNALVRIASVSGGRVLTDFNNPLAGKDIEYIFTIKRIVQDNKEKASALISAFTGFELPFDIDEAKKKIIFKDLRLMPILNTFKDKFKEILGVDTEIFEEKKKEENQKKKEENKQ